MDLFNLENSLFLFAVAANIGLGTLVFLYSPRTIARWLFTAFVLSQICWITANYLSFNVPDDVFTYIVKLPIFFGVLHTTFFYLFVKYFLNNKDQFGAKAIVQLLLGLAICSLTLTTAVFSGTTISESGQIVPIVKPGIGLVGLYIGGMLLAGFIKIVRQIRKTEEQESRQWKFLLTGLSATFLLVVLFSFISFVLFDNPQTVKYGHIYTLPFIVLTAYAMIKHNLLDIKAIAAEIAVALLNFVLLLQVLGSENIGTLALNLFVLTGALITGSMLIRAVRKEIEQRKKLEQLTKELEAANVQLKELDQARADFITIASHQLRTPPSTIKWYLSAILAGDYGKLPPEIQSAVQKANLINNGQMSMIEDLLNASRIERGKLEFRYSQTDLVALVRLAVSELEPLAKMKKLKLTLKATSEPWVSYIDGDKVRQVISNFIDNSIKYTTTGGLEVEIITTSKTATVRVTDTGKGIAKGMEDSVFDKYTRGKDSATHSSGLGLGLYVAKVIVSQHGGKIWAKSPGEGKGSSFYFSLTKKLTAPANNNFDLRAGTKKEVSTKTAK